MTTSLETLELMTRQLADMENSSFVDQAELQRYLQDAYGELYDLLTSKNQDYYVAEPEEFTLSGTNQHALPADFYKLLGVDVSLGSDRWSELDPFMFNERNASAVRRRELGRYARVRYRILGSNLHLVPSDGADGTYRLWYYPTCPVLATTEELDATADKWREFITVSAAIVMLAKEESDTTTLERRKMALIDRIEKASASIDVGRSARIQDVRRGGDSHGDDF